MFVSKIMLNWSFAKQALVIMPRLTFLKKLAAFINVKKDILEEPTENLPSSKISIKTGVRRGGLD